MKLLRSFILFVSLMVLLLIALNNLISGLWGIRLDPVVGFVPLKLIATGPFVHRLYWLGALLLPILYAFLSLILWRRHPGALRVKTAAGENLLIHPGAILKFVRGQIENHPAVIGQKVNVRQTGSRGIAVRAFVTIRPIASMPEITRELESSIRDGLSRVMGIEKVSDIQIVLGMDDKEMSFKPGSAVKAQPLPEPPPRATLLTDEPAINDEHETTREIIALQPTDEL